MWSRTRWSVCLQGRDNPGLGDLIGTAVFHIHRSQQEDITLFCDPRSNGLHDLAVNRLFVVRDEVLIEKLLNLVRGEPEQGISLYRTRQNGNRFDLHPADILNDLNIIQGSLLKLKKLSRLL